MVPDYHWPQYGRQIYVYQTGKNDNAAFNGAFFVFVVMALSNDFVLIIVYRWV